MKSKVFIGMQYYDMEVISKIEGSGGNGKHSRWVLKCKCGREHEVSAWKIGQNVEQCCGCKPKFEDLSGKVYGNGNIVILGFAGYDLRYNRKRPQWFYQCKKCGLVKIETSEVLKRGDISTCGFGTCKPRGEANPKYKINSTTRNTRRDGRRKTWSKNIFIRDNFKCVCCGGIKDTIEAHHLDGWHWCKEKRYDESNGVTLCIGKKSGCHYKFHKEYGKENNTKEQFAEFLLTNYNKDLEEVLQIRSTLL